MRYKAVIYLLPELVASLAADATLVGQVDRLNEKLNELAVR